MVGLNRYWINFSRRPALSPISLPTHILMLGGDCWGTRMILLMLASACSYYCGTYYDAVSSKLWKLVY